MTPRPNVTFCFTYAWTKSVSGARLEAVLEHSARRGVRTTQTSERRRFATSILHLAVDVTATSLVTRSFIGNRPIPRVTEFLHTVAIRSHDRRDGGLNILWAGPDVTAEF